VTKRVRGIHHQKSLVFCPFSGASGAILTKILRDHSFSIPHSSAKICPNPSTFRGDISENVFQTHNSISPTTLKTNKHQVKKNKHQSIRSPSNMHMSYRLVDDRTRLLWEQSDRLDVQRTVCCRQRLQVAAASYSRSCSSDEQPTTWPCAGPTNNIHWERQLQGSCRNYSISTTTSC